MDSAGLAAKTSDIDLSWHELTGAIGDSITVLPIIVSVAVLTDLSLAVMLLWFGVFQIVWGLYYGLPLSVEPMKALAALVIAGGLTAGEVFVAGISLGVLLLLLGTSGTLERLSRYFGTPVVRGIQLGVALILLQTGGELAIEAPAFAGLAVVVTVVMVGTGHWNLSAIAVVVLGGGITIWTTGLPAPALPTVAIVSLTPEVTVGATLESIVAQLAMTLGNAAIATSVLLGDYFDREVSPDRLLQSMGVMNLLAVPFGAIPMCHGSGGVAGKYAFGARTAGANILLGAGYLFLTVFAVGVVAAYPVAMLGVILGLIAIQLGRTSIQQADTIWPVVLVGLCGLVGNLGIALLLGIVLQYWLQRHQ